MSKQKEQNIEKATENGRLYVETSDFFNQKKVQETILELLESEIVKKIDDKETQ